MEEFSYGAGVMPAVVVASLVCVAAVYTRLARGSPPFLLALAAGLGSFAGAYAVLNPLLQITELDGPWFTAEIASGRLALRTASVLVGSAGLGALVQLIRSGPDPFLMDSVQALSTWHERENRRLKRVFAHQAFLYTSVMSLLWLMAAQDRTSVPIVALNWLVTFVVDDWAILGHYTRRYYIRPSWRHTVQLQAVNLLIAGLVVVVLISEYDGWVATTGGPLVLLMFVLVPMLRAFRGVQHRMKDLQSGSRPRAPLGASYDELWARDSRLRELVEELSHRARELRRAHHAAVFDADQVRRSAWATRLVGTSRSLTGSEKVVDALVKALLDGDDDSVAEALRTDPALAAGRDSHGCSLVCRAALLERTPLVDALRGLDPPLDIYDLIALDSVAELETLLRDDPMLWTLDHSGYGSPLAFAVRSGTARAVELLLDAGADPNDRLDVESWDLVDPAVSRMTGMMASLLTIELPDPPLIEATRRGDAAMVRHLLSHGAEPDIPWNGRSPLHYAAHKGHAEIAEVLLAAGADPLLRSPDGVDPSETANAAGHLELAELIRTHQEDALSRLRSFVAEEWMQSRQRRPAPEL